MRLIDADKFFEDFKKISFMNVEGHPMVAGSVVLMLLDSQPTAFNVENVVEELDELFAFNTVHYGAVASWVVDKAKDIVRKGGVE